MRQFYVAFLPDKSRQIASGKSVFNIRSALSSKSETVSRIFTLDALAEAFPLPWSHYIWPRGIIAATGSASTAWRQGRSERRSDGPLMIRLAERTYEEAARLTRDPKTVIVFPLGAIEEHGPHLPLLVGWLGAEELAQVIAPYLRGATGAKGERRPVPHGQRV